MGLSGSDARLVPGQHVSVRVRREERGGRGGGLSGKNHHC